MTAKLSSSANKIVLLNKIDSNMEDVLKNPVQNKEQIIKSGNLRCPRVTDFAIPYFPDG